MPNLALGNALLAATFSFIDDLEAMQRENKRKQQQAVDLYNLSKQMPRKKKKQMKIKAERDWNFWKSLEIWQNQTFPI